LSIVPHSVLAWFAFPAHGLLSVGSTCLLRLATVVHHMHHMLGNGISISFLSNSSFISWVKSNFTGQ
jgi:hypothetical protein